MGIYARETGQGMIFSHDNNEPVDEASVTPVVSPPPRAGSMRAHLKVVK